ncbi:MAG: cysteine--tRNA ligase [Caulobacterales bacterium]|nr:cysteine--tRNA ligase [Caulobacterales bacterium]
MPLVLHDTAARDKRAFAPADPKRVTLYACGPTVYNYAHIGNARPAVVVDVLYRLLRRAYGADHVIYSRNFTDVDDKIIAAAAETGEPITAITERFTAIYRADMGALGVLTPTLEPTATSHIEEMIALAERLVANGAAYEAEGHVLFHVPAFDDYGALSGRSRDDQIAGARVEVAPYKKDPADFVLWKPAADDEPGWMSPWGRGRPGWHLECSAMIEAGLGETIDIHAGGQDLVFPHHENERAQSACVHGGAPLARFWVHNGFLTMDAEKMSKSLGNVRLVHDLLETYPGEVLRWALLSAHYRQPLDWTDDLLRQARATLDGWYQALRRLKDVEAEAGEPPAAVVAALEDDLNTPRAFAEMSALANKANKAGDPSEQSRLKGALLAAGALVGLLQVEAETWFQGAAGEGGLDAGAIEAQLAARQEARKAKNFAEADRIRDELAAAGVMIEDGPGGSTWRRSG